MYCFIDVNLYYISCIFLYASSSRIISITTLHTSNVINNRHVFIFSLFLFIILKKITFSITNETVQNVRNKWQVHSVVTSWTIICHVDAHKLVIESFYPKRQLVLILTMFSSVRKKKKLIYILDKYKKQFKKSLNYFLYYRDLRKINLLILIEIFTDIYVIKF